MTSVTISSFAIIIFAALIHASFQVSVSVLTLLSGHSLGKKTASRKVLSLMNGFNTGVLLLTVLLISAITYYLVIFINHISATEQLVASIVCGLMVGLGVATWAFYYRKGKGTTLWIPRGFADYLNKRTKATKNSFEAFALGMTSVVAELIFIISPSLAAALAIVTLPGTLTQVSGIILYALLSISPLLIITSLVGSGHSVASLQKWREEHKRFLQFASGGSLLILAAFLFVDRVVGLVSYGNGLW